MQSNLLADEKNRYCDNRNIYLEKHQLLLFKIPKVAGTSMWQVAANLLGHQISTEAQTRQFRLPEIASTELHHHADVYKAAFVRNPWDRLLSCYLQKRGKPHIFFFQRNPLRADMTFEQFVKAIHAIPDYQSDRHFRSQYTFITNQEGRIIADFVGEFSNFTKDLTHILTTRNIPATQVPHWNKTKHHSYTAYYTPELVRLIAERYAIDIALFGYEFGKSIPTDFYSRWQSSMSKEMQLKITQYKANKLLHNLNVLQERSILSPKNMRQRLRILLKGK